MATTYASSAPIVTPEATRPTPPDYLAASPNLRSSMLRVRHSPIHFEVAEGVVLAGDAWGEPDAPPVVLLTGAGQTRHAWGQTGEALAAAATGSASCRARVCQ